MSEKKRENGYYWVRDHVGGAFMVQVADDWVLLPGDDEWDSLIRYERDFEFIGGPLKPPEAP